MDLWLMKALQFIRISSKINQQLIKFKQYQINPNLANQNISYQ